MHLLGYILSLLLLAGCSYKTEPQPAQATEPLVQTAVQPVAKTNTQNTQRNTLLLMNAVRNKEAEQVMFLLQGGINPNTLTPEGDSALVAASFNGAADIVQFLLHAGQFQKGRFIFIPVGIVVGYRHNHGIFQFAMVFQFFQKPCEHVVYQFCF